MRRSREEVERFIRWKANEKRREMTKAEKRLWGHLEEMGFRAQVEINLPRFKHPSHVDSYILDFLQPDRGICVEADGGYHKQRVGSDRRRDTRLQLAGIRTLRFSNDRIFDDLDRVLREVEEALNGPREV